MNLSLPEQILWYPLDQFWVGVDVYHPFFDLVDVFDEHDSSILVGAIVGMCGVLVHCSAVWSSRVCCFIPSL